MKPIFKNLILVIASIFISVLFLEIIFRTFMPQLTYNTAIQSSPRIYQKSSYMPWTLKPNSTDIHIAPYGDFNVTVSINSYGLRDYERSVDKNAKRVLVMGDSMTYGYGVEMNESYPKQLEKLLKRSGNYQVFNSGFANSYSVDNYYLYLKNYGLEKFQPDVIVLGFFVYNDISDISLNKWTVDENKLPIKIESNYYSVDEQSRLRSAKRTLPILKNSAVKNIYDFLLANSHLFVFVKTTIASRVAISSSNRVFDINYNEKLEEDWNSNKKLLLAINLLTKENNIKFIIVVIPVQFQIDDALWEQYTKRVGNQIDRRKPNELLLSFGKENNITVIDTYDSLYRAQKEISLFLPIDGHLNSEGNRVISKDIYNFLSKTKY